MHSYEPIFNHSLRLKFPPIQQTLELSMVFHHNTSSALKKGAVFKGLADTGSTEVWVSAE